ncbi:MAG: adenosine deaminase [Planctomycetes bacterium]|nr:adenosine deaminase [Planctomycetota bacterium]
MAGRTAPGPAPAPTAAPARSRSARAASLDALLPALPKIDLHLHLDGALRVATIAELARERRVPLPTYDPQRLRHYVQVGPRCRSVAEFLATFRYFYPVLADAAALERVAYELCEDQSRAGVIYFEARYAPVLLAHARFRPAETVRAVLRGLEAGGRDFGVAWGLILCCYRGAPPASSTATVRLAAAARDRGVVGIDLAGDERRHSAAPHQRAFDLARRLGVPATLHAGESAPPAGVRDALDLQHARRIGHGVHLEEDPDLAARVRDRRVPLEMCMTSNLQTRVVRRAADHPFGRFLRAGFCVTLNADDPGVSGITLIDEWRRAARTFDLSLAELRTVALNGAEAAFAPAAVRRALARRIADGFARVAAGTKKGKTV